MVFMCTSKLLLSAWCMCCFCIVISYCSIKNHQIISKIIRIIWRYWFKKKCFLYKMGVHTPLVSAKWACVPPWSLFSCSCSFSRNAVVALMVIMLSYLLWSASVSTRSGVLLSDWSLYRMGVHCVCVVFVLVFDIVPLKSSNTDENHLSI